MVAVFDHLQAVLRRRCQDCAHVGGQAEEVSREHGLGPLVDRWADATGVEVERPRVDIHEDGLGPEASDGARGIEEDKGAQDHLIARADAQTHHRHQQRIGAGRHADHPLHRALSRAVGGEPLGEGLLEPLDVSAQDVIPRGEHALEGLAKLGHQVAVLRGQVEQGDAGVATWHGGEIRLPKAGRGRRRA